MRGFIVAASAVAAASELRPEPLALDVFNENFHVNAFCRSIFSDPESYTSDHSKNLLTGEVTYDGDNTVVMDSRGEVVRYDATHHDKASCEGAGMEWTNVIEDEVTWRRLVQKEVERVKSVPTEQHSWIAVVWPHQDVDSSYTAMLGKHLSLPHHDDQDEEGNLVTDYTHSAFSHFHNMKNFSGTATNPGFFVLPLNARMAQLAQDHALFEYLFPLPAILKLDPSVRVYVDHHQLEKPKDGLTTDGGEHLDIVLTPVANGPNHRLVTDSAAIVEEWNAQLREQLKASGLHFTTTSKYLVTLERKDNKPHAPAHLDLVTEWLLRDGRVAHVELRPHYRVSNQYAAATTQVDLPPNPDQTQLNTMQFPIYQKNIKGQGQVVGVGDSGLDYNSCFFRDDQVPINPNQISQGPNAQATNFPGHRKVLQYFGYADNKAGQTKDHGTHVAGTVAGKNPNPSPPPNPNPNKQADTYQGAAPEAKVAFFDIGLPNAQNLNVPPSIKTQMFPPSKTAGAGIHTNSWGGQANTYNIIARDMDDYMYENHEFLILVAAGNSGRAQNGQYRPASVGTPATAKNVIGVGASLGPKASFIDAGVFQSPQDAVQFTKTEDSMASFSSSGPTFDGRQQPVVSAPGMMVTSANSQAANANTCQVHAIQGTSMATPVVAGNAALQRQYYMDGWYPYGKKDPAESRTPTGALLKAALVMGARVLQDRDRIQQPLTRAGQPVTQRGLADTVQGQGVVTMTRSMHFDDSPYETLVMGGFCPRQGACNRANFNNMENLNTGDPPKTYQVELAGSSEDLVVVLAWTDPPPGPNAGATVTVNNLDLTVTVGGKIYRPIDPTTGRQDGPITKDVVERVVVPKAQLAGVTSVTVTVTGTDVKVGPQPFAAIAGGPLKKKNKQVPVDPSPDEVVDGVENSGNAAEVAQQFTMKEGGNDGPVYIGLVVCLILVLVLMVILLVVLFVMNQWCCFARAPDNTITCTVYFLLVMRLVLFSCAIAAFVIGGMEQLAIEKRVPTAKFGNFWQQYLVVAVGIFAVVTAILGILLGVMQLKKEEVIPSVNVALMILDFVVALMSLIASASIASVGTKVFLFWKTALSALVIMAVSLMCVLAEAGLGLSRSEDSSVKNSYKANGGIDYKNGNTGKRYKANGAIDYAKPVEMSASPSSRRRAPEAPRERRRARPQSVRGEILVALYDYEGQDSDEISFYEGARIELIEDHQDGWAFGTLLETRRQGLFPLNYTESEQDSGPPAPKSERV